MYGIFPPLELQPVQFFPVEAAAPGGTISVS